MRGDWAGARSVDVVVCVRAAPDAARRCLESVLACTGGPFRLLLIDDAPGDPRVTALIDEFARRNDRRIEPVRREGDRDCASTVRRVIARSRDDVVLLDSSAIVTKGLIDALVRCAASDPRIATVTPFVGGAGTGLLARFGEDRGVGDDAERVRDAIARSAVPTYPDLPVAGGPCVFLRRAAIDAIAANDFSFGDRDRELTAFCVRAARAGWRNVLADDAFVIGESAQSSGEDGLGGHTVDGVVHLNGEGEAILRDYAAADPLGPLRDAAASRLAASSSAQRVLHVLHDHGGGTETHVRALIGASRARWRHCLAVAVDDRWQVDEHFGEGSTRTFTFVRGEGESWRDFIGGIVETFRISVIHVHHLSRSRAGALAALQALDVPYGITIHDLWLACPTVTMTPNGAGFCGGVTDVARCTQCLATQPALADIDIADWRRAHAELLAGAAFLVAPSHWAAEMLERYFPQAAGRVQVIAHATPVERSRSSKAKEPRAPMAVLLPRDDRPTIAVIGAIGPDKGARRIERLAERVRARGERVRFVVIGYLDVQHRPWQSADAVLTVHGRYSPADLPALVAHYRVALVVFPSEGPESFSHTLSEAWRAGVPALVPPIGALPERVRQSGAGWVMTDDEWNDDDRMLDRMMALLAPETGDELDRVARVAQGVAHTTPEAMAEATVANYARLLVCGHRGYAVPAFSNRRIRDALGYREWKPPSITDPAPAIPEQRRVGQRFAQRVLTIRRTSIGRLLYRVIPEPVLQALKARLGRS